MSDDFHRASKCFSGCVDHLRQYRAALLRHLLAPSDHHFTATLEAAKNLDSSYASFDLKSDIADGLSDLVWQLLTHDNDAWMKLLCGMWGDEEHALFKRVSPFAEVVIGQVFRRGDGDHDFEVELDHDLALDGVGEFAIIAAKQSGIGVNDTRAFTLQIRIFDVAQKSGGNEPQK